MRAAILLALCSLACSFNPPGRCSSAAECNDGTICREGICSACSANAQCSPWQFCGGLHLCASQAGRCSTSNECGSGFFCDVDNNCKTSAYGGGGAGGGSTGGTGGTGSGGPGNCSSYPPGTTPGSNIVSVSGQAGTWGAVSYTTYGSAPTNSSIFSILHTELGNTLGTQAARVGDTWIIFINKDPLQAGTTYQADNSNPSSYVPPYLQFGIDPSAPNDATVACPNNSSATGQVSITQFQYPGDGTPQGGVVGTFSYQCPSGNINVTGCFRFTGR